MNGRIVAAGRSPTKAEHGVDVAAYDPLLIKSSYSLPKARHSGVAGVSGIRFLHNGSPVSVQNVQRFCAHLAEVAQMMQDRCSRSTSTFFFFATSIVEDVSCLLMYPRFLFCNIRHASR